MDRAKRSVVAIGELEIEGFQMPDGSYRMSQTQAAEIVGLSERNARDFLRSSAIKRLLGEGYTPAITEVEIDASEQSRGQSRINALPLEIVTAYWVWQCFRGNKQAIALVMALATEALDRRFDAAFGVTRSEAEYDERFSDRVGRLQRDLATLSEAYAEPDLLREENDRLRDQLRQNGIEPWSIASGDSDA
ncbi:MAG: hypothetical protein AAFQ89_15495 [Cyanobacteria bacterium J06626_18]